MTEVLGLWLVSLLAVAGRLLLALLLAAVQLYVFRAVRRMIRSLELGARKEQIGLRATGVLFAVVNLPLLGFVVEAVVSERGSFIYSPPPEYEPVIRPFAYVFFVWTLGSLCFALVSPLTMAVFAAVQFFRRKGAGASPTTTVQAFDFSRRRFLRTALLGVSSMPFAVSAYGAVAAVSRKTVEYVEVAVEGLPPQLEGFTIVQMSDIHSGLFMTEEQMREYVKLANSLSPDLVALTGDFVATSNKQVEPFIRAISGLQAKQGVFGCLGNHDIFSNSETALVRGFAKAGFKLLRNSNQLISIGGATLNVIGVDFIGFRSSLNSLRDALKRVSLEGTTVLLSHSPSPFPEAARLGINLMLAGHTHGGQIALTIGDLLITPARLATMFVAGLFKIDGSYLYVNRGIGTTGPPIRINAPPEITHITLRRSKR